VTTGTSRTPIARPVSREEEEGRRQTGFRLPTFARVGRDSYNYNSRSQRSITRPGAVSVVPIDVPQTDDIYASTRSLTRSAAPITCPTSINIEDLNNSISSSVSSGSDAARSSNTAMTKQTLETLNSSGIYMPPKSKERARVRRSGSVTVVLVWVFTGAIVAGLVFFLRKGRRAHGRVSPESFLKELFQPYSGILNDTTTAQYKACQWLADDPRALEYHHQQLTQRYALASMYFSLEGGNWKWRDDKRKAWLSESSECEWMYVSCDDIGNVVDIGFRQYQEPTGLFGSLPREIGLLTHLSSIEIEIDPGLAGTIPTEIGLLSGLVRIDITDTYLSGAIPTEIGLLTLLATLQLTSNSLSSTIPTEIGLLKDLDVFDLSLNEITGSIPSDLGGLTDLGYLLLEENHLKGSIPSELAQLTDLSLLNLDDNRLTGTIPKNLCENAITRFVVESFGEEGDISC